MPEIKTYIPEGPTRFSQEANKRLLSTTELHALSEDKLPETEFLNLRDQIVSMDETEFGIKSMEGTAVYPQAIWCTQSMASIYVTIQGEIRSCVGSHIVYGKYEPEKGLLEKTLKERKERVGLGCTPRLEEMEEIELEKKGTREFKQMCKIYEGPNTEKF